MRKESSSERIHEALNFLDEDMIEEVDQLRWNQMEGASDSTDAEKQAETVSKSGIKGFSWRRVTALAASLCLLVIGSWAWENYVGPSTEDKMNKEDMEYNDRNPAIMDSQQPDKEDDAAQEGVLDSDLIDYGTDNNTDGVVEYESEVKSPEQDSNEIDENPTEMLTVLGDEYHLQNNYVNVSMLPHKVWTETVSEEEALQKAVTIDAEYKKDIDKLVEAMCTANCVLTEELPASDTDMIYHLFFERTDGEVVHCWLLENGYLYYHDKSDVCLSLDRATYGTTFKILAMHW